MKSRSQSPRRAVLLTVCLLAMSWLVAPYASAQTDSTEGDTPEQLEQRLGIALQAHRELLRRIAEMETAETESAEAQALLRQRIAELEVAKTRSSLEQEGLERRISELENARSAQEEATRSIIRQTLGTLGSRINEFVIFGGTLELSAENQGRYVGVDEADLALDTAEFDFEIEVTNWTVANIILEYVRESDGRGAAEGRLNLDTGHLTIGDGQRFWPSGMLGQMVVPFGTSTGDPVADVLTLEDPLTVGIFEMTEVAVLLRAEFPTPPVRPATLRPGPPPVQPRMLAPFVGRLARLMGYKPYPVPPPTQNFVASAGPPAPFSLALFTFDGVTFARRRDEDNWNPTRHAGVTAGYRRRGHPWSLDLALDWNSSVFDSDFLGSEYGNFLDQIGLVPGMGTSVKAARGPVGLVVEWNGALEHAKFTDDTGALRRLRPSAWQASLGYQLGWNRTVEAIGSEGTYFALGYSESRSMAGATALLGEDEVRVGSLPRWQLLLTAGEWVLDGTRVALEYSHRQDYLRHEGGTGGSARGIAAMITTEW